VKKLKKFIEIENAKEFGEGQRVYSFRQKNFCMVNDIDQEFCRYQWFKEII
jgi:hypothetical protein